MNGSRFSEEVKQATIKDWKATRKGKPKMTAREIGLTRGVSTSTVRQWAAKEGLQRDQHPNTLKANIKRIKKLKAEKDFNTPIVKSSKSIMYQGTRYRAVKAK